LAAFGNYGYDATELDEGDDRLAKKADGFTGNLLATAADAE
jgi:hypothetical protein